MEICGRRPIPQLASAVLGTNEKHRFQWFRARMTPLTVTRVAYASLVAAEKRSRFL